MTETKNLLSRLAVPTLQITSQTLQDLIILQKRGKYKLNEETILDAAAVLLWQHLQHGLTKWDDQLLCATCFYNSLIFINNKHLYLQHIIEILDVVNAKDYNVTKNENTIIMMSLMYGIFQSSILSSLQDDTNLMKDILTKSFDILIVISNEYSRYTFLAFKIITSFKKVIGTNFEHIIFKKENQITLLNLVCHNWENPISGVRDLIKCVFQVVIFVVDKQFLSDIVNEINSFNWNKAKYLMLAEIILQEKGFVVSMLNENSDWINGLISSLGKPGLVSAGADMYFAILKHLKTEEEWYAIFIAKITNILNGDFFKEKENFFNYWCLNTFKLYPKTLNSLYNGINIGQQNQNLYCAVNLLKQGNRIGLVNKTWDDHSVVGSVSNLITIGIENGNPYVRMAAFDLVCITQGLYLPSIKEFDLIYYFLRDNINSDCTVLRLNTLNSFTIFLNNLHNSYMHTIKHNDKDVKEIFKFCVSIQTLIKKSISIKGNYQRKVTAIKLCDILITSLSGVSRKKNMKQCQSKKTLLYTLKTDGYWLLSDLDFINKVLLLLKDPSEDIKESVAQILFQHYASDLIELHLIESVINNAFDSIKSKFFYDVSSGKAMFKLLSNLLINYKVGNILFNNIDDMFSIICQEFLNEYIKGEDILESIEKGRQLHSFITVLNSILNVCLKSGYSFKIMLDEERLKNILKAINDISKQFMGDHEDSAVSSDFSKMSDIVNNVIEKSGYDPYNRKDETKISGLHQIVLNTIWQNVKASCELAATLVKSHRHHMSIDISKQCLELIAHVLVTSRHKGVIEAAGAALGQCIHELTFLPKEIELPNLAEEFLKCKLEELMCDASQTASVTRRGAGLSIMVHRIVSNDMGKSKPLFHYFMKRLLEVCTKLDESSLVNDNEMDIPRAVYIHFLTRIVIDSTFASDIMYYSSNLAEIAFNNLTNEKWQIRNAALQLYGALVPKVIGQKKSSGDNEETISTVACDEFRVHSPKLWKYIQEQLRVEETANNIQSHSNLVPILNLLSNCAKRYNFSYNLATQAVCDEAMFDNLFNLLNSPIYTVRRLTAKCIYNNFPFQLIFSNIVRKKPETENYLHGILILAQICYINYFQKGMYPTHFVQLKSFFKTIFSVKHSYLCRFLYDDMFLDIKCNIIENLATVLLEAKENCHVLGISTWSNNIISKYMQRSTWEIMPNIIIKLIQADNYTDTYCKILYDKLLCNDIPLQILKEIVEIFFNDPKTLMRGLLSQIMYEISLKDIIIYEDINNKVNIYDFIKAHKGEIYTIRYLIPLAARSFVFASDKDQMDFINMVLSLTDVEMVDCDLRYIAALANNELGNHFANLSDNMKVIVIKSAIILLQDEDEEVRNTAVHFYMNITTCDNVLQSYICLQNLLNYTFLKNLFKDTVSSVSQLCSELDSLLQKYSELSEIKDEYNPFANNSKNIYFEGDILREYLNTLRIDNDL